MSKTSEQLILVKFYFDFLFFILRADLMIKENKVCVYCIFLFFFEKNSYLSPVSFKNHSLEWVAHPGTLGSKIADQL
jgi:hypothetical protein